MHKSNLIQLLALNRAPQESHPDPQSIVQTLLAHGKCSLDGTTLGALD